MFTVQITDQKIYSSDLTITNKDLRIKAYNEIKLPKNTVENGYIQDMDTLKEQLDTILLENNYKHVFVTLDSTSIIYRELDLPKSASSKLDKAVYYKVQQQIKNIQDFVVDYAVLASSKTGVLKLLVTAVPKKLIEDYYLLFNTYKNIQFKITTTPMNLIRRNELELVTNESQIIVDYTAGMYTTMLLNNGEFTFVIQFKQGNELSKLERITTLVERVSQMVQFQKAKEKDSTIKKITVSGELDAKEQLQTAFSTNVGMNITTFENQLQFESTSIKKEIANSFLYAVIKSKLKNIDFNHPINENEFGTSGQNRKLLLVTQSVISINIMILVLAIMVVYLKINTIRSQKEEIHQLMDAKYVEKYEKAVLFTEENKAMNVYLDEVKNIETTILASKGITKELFDQFILLKPTTTVLNSIQSTNGRTIDLSFSTPERTDSFNYVQNLIDSDLFEDVNYSVITYNETQNQYTYIVVLVMKGGN